MIKKWKQYNEELSDQEYQSIIERDPMKNFDSPNYKLVRFAYNDVGNNATALVDKKQKKILSFSLTGSSELDKYQELTK